jgi:hypothetical protein
MVNERKYFDSIQKKIGDTYSADQIFDDPWKEVVEELNQLSIHYCRELQEEAQICYKKYDKNHSLEQFPPYRLLATSIVLADWIGYHSAEKFQNIDWNMIKNAYEAGKLRYNTEQSQKQEKSS